MNDEAKLGLVAGVLAVVGVAVFGFPKEQQATASAPPALTAPAQLPANAVGAAR